jgi:hypothetical protein
MNKKAVIYLSYLAISLGVLYHLALITRPKEYLPDRPFQDDSFYSFTIAKHLALKKVFMIDGKNRTNGFQPLITIISSIPFLFTKDKYTSLRVIHFFHLIIHILSGWLFTKFLSFFIRDPVVKLLAFATWIVSFYIFSHSSNGLETGLYLFMILAVSWYYLKKIMTDPSFSSHFLFGILLGLLTLTRIDGGFFCLCIGVHYIIFKKHYKNALPPLIWFILWLIVTLPWWTYNYLLTKSIIPTSGSTQTFIYTTGKYFPLKDIFTNIYYSLHALSDQLFLFLITPNRMMGHFSTLSGGWLFIKMASLISLLLFLLKTTPNIFKSIWHDKKDIFKKFMFYPFFIACLLCFYNFYFYVWWFLGRYLIPFIIMAAILWFCVLEKQKRIFQVAFISFGIFFFIVSACITYKTHLNDLYTDQFGWVKKNVSNHHIIGAMQSGTLGYFHDNTINLDGKVNKDILMLNKDSLTQYLLYKKVDYVIDWPIFKYLKHKDFLKHYEFYETYGTCQIYKRKNELKIN